MRFNVQVGFQRIYDLGPRVSQRYILIRSPPILSKTNADFRYDSWDSSDHGSALYGQLKGCAILPDTWHFDYGLGDDGREWTAKFRTGVFQKKCVGHAGNAAGAQTGFGCNGSG